jgi:short-subunit dehydrogenase
VSATYPFTRALVTGASSGIGEELTRQLATAGVPTVVVARRVERLEALAGELTGVEVLEADLVTDAGVTAVGARITDAERPVDLVVNNAGFGTSGEFHTLDPDRLADEVDLNVATLTRLSHIALSMMIERRRGWLLNVSSVASFQPAPKLAVYAATKAYVTSLSESLHNEAKPYGVTVSALCPGLTRTEFQAVSNTRHYQSRVPDFAWTTVEEVATAGLEGVAKGRALIVPGAFYKSVVSAGGVTPRWIKRALSNVVRRD